MCLSTVYIDSGDKKTEFMKEVAKIEAEANGFWLINLFGERSFIEGKVKSINLVDGYLVIK